MVVYRDKCDRYFNWKGNSRRHQNRKIPCRKATHVCTDCKKIFVSQESLGKHKTLYCKANLIQVKEEVKEYSALSLSDILDMWDLPPPPAINSDDNIPPTPANINEAYNPFEPSFKEAVNEQQQHQEEEVPASTEGSAPFYFDEMIQVWMDEILRLEGKFMNNVVVRGEVGGAIDRMLADGLISPNDHANLKYANQLFLRLHDLIYMNMNFHNRREIVDILANLFEIGKISKAVFIEMCVNI